MLPFQQKMKAFDTLIMAYGKNRKVATKMYDKYGICRLIKLYTIISSNKKKDVIPLSSYQPSDVTSSAGDLWLLSAIPKKF